MTEKCFNFGMVHRIRGLKYIFYLYPFIVDKVVFFFKLCSNFSGGRKGPD